MKSFSLAQRNEGVAHSATQQKLHTYRVGRENPAGKIDF
jgi:hypothetical protein